MIPSKLLDRLDRLTDALVREKDLDSAFLASVLLAAQDSVRSNELAAFAQRVWQANNSPQEQDHSERPAAVAENLKRSVRRRKVG
jgi:hypothetical protein